MKLVSAQVLLLALAACRAADTVARPPLAVPSGLEEVRILAKGME